MYIQVLNAKVKVFFINQDKSVTAFYEKLKSFFTLRFIYNARDFITILLLLIKA